MTDKRKNEEEELESRKNAKTQEVIDRDDFSQYAAFRKPVYGAPHDAPAAKNDTDESAPACGKGIVGKEMKTRFFRPRSQPLSSDPRKHRDKE